ncbi:hypothetical protein BBW65_01980 [Helicobacter enhydrae]|uniref:Uncharacterized protein n=1 Tax=Helicobacter enhydrae TaxID=222136 RepID=A0A1B1U4H6_9HELI|nr:hypothetical protein [Helicobacter enhydrae]ANV97649.1 hypothetical protein BBW65_01980 [Helicobacter enhydrae]
MQTASTRQDTLDQAYIEKLRTKNEKQLKGMMDALEKETMKINAEKKRIENKLNNRIRKKHFIQDALMEKWRTPSARLLNAIEEVERGEVVSFENHQQAMEYLNNDED